MNDEEKLKNLTCTQCGTVEECFSSIVYSQGERVCLICKDKNKESDNHAFDIDMKYWGMRDRMR